MASCHLRTQIFRSNRRCFQDWARPTINGNGRAISRLCDCRKAVSNAFSPCMWIPRHTFASSRFNTVMLLILRLFYQASSFERGEKRSWGVSSINHAPVKQNMRQTGPESAIKSFRQIHQPPPEFFSAYERISTIEWRDKALSHSEQFSMYKVVSMTWVKALASPFSHEFIQFIVEHPGTRGRTRIAVGREETGDWVICGWNWGSGDPPSHHYTLPLPLLSLTFHESDRPDIGSISHLLAAVTEKKPQYNLIREMCWWYAETIFEEMNSRYGGSVKEWEWSKYRYSFIVKTGILKRKVLTDHAEAFRHQIANEMQY